MGLHNKNILLGVTGGIAAYKSADLIRKLQEQGATVRVVMTPAAKEFITSLTLQALSGHPVQDNLLDPGAEAAMGHIELARWADIVLIAPATADFLARLAYGHANDLLATLCLATHAPIMIAPAMNQQMWRGSATQNNLRIISQRGVKILGPAEGEQACGDIGPGRMLEPLEIVYAVANQIPSRSLEGKKVLITAGPTREYLDPVRYLTNLSSGKMGYAIAESAVTAGAEVTLVTGPVNLEIPVHTKACQVETSEQMYQAVMERINEQDIFIAAAAVCDYRPVKQSLKKIQKSEQELVVAFERTPDILAAVAAQYNPLFTVGFAAQTEEIVKYARDKLQNKCCDLIAANQVGVNDRGFNSDNNALTLIWSDGQKELPLMSKKQLAHEFIQFISERYNAKYSIKNTG